MYAVPQDFDPATFDLERLELELAEVVHVDDTFYVQINGAVANSSHVEVNTGATASAPRPCLPLCYESSSSDASKGLRPVSLVRDEVPPAHRDTVPTPSEVLDTLARMRQQWDGPARGPESVSKPTRLYPTLTLPEPTPILTCMPPPAPDLLSALSNSETVAPSAASTMPRAAAVPLAVAMPLAAVSSMVTVGVHLSASDRSSPPPAFAILVPVSAPEACTLQGCDQGRNTKQSDAEPAARDLCRPSQPATSSASFTRSAVISDSCENAEANCARAPTRDLMNPAGTSSANPADEADPALTPTQQTFAPILVPALPPATHAAADHAQRSILAELDEARLRDARVHRALLGQSERQVEARALREREKRLREEVRPCVDY